MRYRSVLLTEQKKFPLLFSQYFSFVLYRAYARYNTNEKKPIYYAFEYEPCITSQLYAIVRS